jgi:predicted ester cyclase
MRKLSNSTKAATGLLLLAFVVIIAGFSPLSIKQGSQVDAKSLAKKAIDAFNKRTPELLNQIFAAKITYHSQSDTESSEATIRPIYDNNLATYPDFKFTLDDVVAEGNKVAIRAIFEGTHKTYGKKVRIASHWIGRVEGGKFVEMWEVVDAAWQQQLVYTITSPEQERNKEKASINETKSLKTNQRRNDHCDIEVTRKAPNQSCFIALNSYVGPRKNFSR